MIFDPKEMLGLLDLRSMGYYKIIQGILQQKLSKYCRFESAENLFEQFHNFKNTLKERKKRRNAGKIPMVRFQVMKENICQKEKFKKKYIDVEKSCLTDEEKN